MNSVPWVARRWESRLPPGGGQKAYGFFGDRILKGTVDDAMLESLTQVCFIDELLDQASDMTDPGTAFSKAELFTLAGRQVVGRHLSEDGGGSTLYVDTEGDFYPMKVEMEGDESRAITLSSFDAEVAPTPPAAEHSVDVSMFAEMTEGE